MKDQDLVAIAQKASNVKLVVIGVDGVLTDAGMYFSDSGDYLRKFNRRDGMGIELLKRYEIKSAVLSSIDSAIVRIWAQMFSVDFVRLGIGDKLHEIEKIQMSCGLRMEEVAYISDDIDELEILKNVGFSATVADGMSMNKKISDYVTKRTGGQGAVRELIEIIIRCKRLMGDKKQ